MLPDDIRAGLESLAEELGNSTVARALSTLIRDLAPQLAELRAQASAKNQAEFKRLAHNLKGRCGLLRLMPLREAAYALELASQDSGPQRRLELLASLEQRAKEWAPGLQQIQAEFASRPD